MMVQKWLPCGRKLSFLYFTWQEQGTRRHYYLVSSFPALRRPRGQNHLHGGLWAIEDGLDWEDRGRCDEGNKMIGTRGRKCSKGREHETPRGGTVPENMRWWITLVNAFERWKWHFKLVWGNCFVKCYIIYDLDHMRCGFMSITLLWEDETKWKKRSWNSSPLKELLLDAAIEFHWLINIKKTGPRNVKWLISVRQWQRWNLHFFLTPKPNVFLLPVLYTS